MSARFRSLLLIAAMLGMAAMAHAQSTSLPVAAPETRGFKPRALGRIGSLAKHTIPSLGAFLVWRHGALIDEEYFHGMGRDSLFNVKSVTKSVVSAIAGAAYGHGYLRDLDRPVLDVLTEYVWPKRAYTNVWFPESLMETDSIRRTLTLRHLLTMTTGQEYQDGSMISSAAFNSSDPVRFMLELPYEDDPGSTFNYSTGASHVFAAALARLVGTDLRTFADSTLFSPIGITIRRWDTDQQGRYGGGSELFLTARDLIRLGVLYLNRGRVDGRQIIPEDWVSTSTAVHVPITRRWTIPGVEGYGYYWWVRRGTGHRMFCAMGYGGQVICVIPDLDMVMVMACTLGEDNRGRAELPRIHGVMDRVVRAMR